MSCLYSHDSWFLDFRHNRKVWGQLKESNKHKYPITTAYDQEIPVL